MTYSPEWPVYAFFTALDTELKSRNVPFAVKFGPLRGERRSFIEQECRVWVDGTDSHSFGGQGTKRETLGDDFGKVFAKGSHGVAVSVRGGETKGRQQPAHHYRRVWGYAQQVLASLNHINHTAGYRAELGRHGFVEDEAEVPHGAEYLFQLQVKSSLGDAPWAEPDAYPVDQLVTYQLRNATNTADIIDE